MKRILVTPAGRKRYLELLYLHLLNLRNEFDEWVLWVNTNVKEDILYIEELEKNNDFIRLQRSKMDFGFYEVSSAIYHFFKEAQDENSVYIRLDDDIIYIEPNSLKDLFNFRIENPQYFLVHGNIVNNSICSHLHQNKGLFFDTELNFGYSFVDENGWKNPIGGEYILRKFLNLYNDNKISEFFLENWVLKDYVRCSVNVISWLGSEFKKFNAHVDREEESWLTVTIPKKIKKPNIIFGNSLFVHYSYLKQRSHMDKTDILEKYKTIANSLKK